jgi:hypothetical protein
MRPLRTLTLLVVVFAFLFSVATPITASAEQQTNCFKLSKADCKIYTTAVDNLSKLNVFQPRIDLTIDYRYHDRTLKYVAKGTGAIDFSSEDVLNAAETGDQQKLVKAIKLSLDLDGTLTTTEKGKKTTTKLGIKYVVLDGYQYVQVITDGKASAWESDDLATQLANQQYIQNASTSNLDPATRKAVEELLSDPDFIAAIIKLPSTPNFLTLTRTATAQTIDKQRMIEFAYVYDFALLFRTREMNTIMKKFLDFAFDQAGQQKPTTTQVNYFVGLLANALSGTTLKIKPLVGATDTTFHGLTIEAAFNFKGSVIYSTDNVSAKITLKMVFNKIGEPVTIAQPE